MMTDKKERGVYTLVFWLSNGMSVFFHPAGTQYHTRDDLPISRKNGKKRGIGALHKNRQPCKKNSLSQPGFPRKRETRNGKGNACLRGGKEARNQAIMSMFGSFQAGSYPLA